MSSATQIPALLALAAVEVIILRRGSRRLFWAAAQASRSRTIAYTLALPGTVLHEGAHWLACLALRVPVGQVRLFWPQRTAEGDVVLGGVSHARTDPLRQSLIAIAPLLIAPPVLALLTQVLLGPGALDALPDVLGHVALWRALLWGYLVLSCGQAAYPSPGDRIGAAGALALAGLFGGATLVVSAFGGTGALGDVLAAVVGLLALPAGAASAGLAVLSLRRLLGRGLP